LVDNNGDLKGVITEGDLRRMLKNEANVYEMSAKEAMTANPKTIESGKLAYEALSIMKEKNIACLPVMEDSKVVGTIRMQAILGAGIV
jgi:arabinose-5-phosphate isomerase